MSDTNKKNQSNSNKTVIGGNTVIQFTFKGFITLIIAILSIFYGFYQVVIQPEVERTAEHQRELYIQQRNYIDHELNQLENAIQANTRTIEATNERFVELNKAIKKASESSGSLGNGLSIKIDTTNIIDSLDKKLPTEFKPLADNSD